MLMCKGGDLTMSEELLPTNQEAAAQMLATGGIEKSVIANRVGVSRTTLYNWTQKEKFAARVATLRHEFTSFGIDLIQSKFVDAINNYWEMIQETEDSRVKAEGFRYFIDRQLGKPSTKLDVNTDTTNQRKIIDADELEKELDELETSEDKEKTSSDLK